jgi:hypothetical protein
MACLQRSLLGGGEPTVALTAPTERVDLDEHSWVDFARGWLLGADTLFEALATTVPWRRATASRSTATASCATPMQASSPS